MTAVCTLYENESVCVFVSGKQDGGGQSYTRDGVLGLYYLTYASGYVVGLHEVLRARLFSCVRTSVRGVVDVVCRVCIQLYRCTAVAHCAVQ